MTEATAPADTGEALTAPVETGQASDDTSTQTNWYDSAPDEVKGYIQNKGWDDPVKAVTSYQELEKFRGASEDQLLKLPKDMAEEGALDTIYDRLGRPESADKYDVQFPEGLEVDSNRLSAYQEAAYNIGLSQKQFEALATIDAEYMSQASAAYAQERAAKQEAEYAALQKEWGGNAQEREELSRRGLRALLPDGADKDSLVSQIEDAIGTAATLKLFANAGEKLAREDKIHESGDDRPFGYTREQAVSDRRALMSELSADSKRLDNYNKGKGPDFDKMKRINKIISS